jgi:hypothetical protein
MAQFSRMVAAGEPHHVTQRRIGGIRSSSFWHRWIRRCLEKALGQGSEEKNWAKEDKWSKSSMVYVDVSDEPCPLNPLRCFE